MFEFNYDKFTDEIKHKMFVHKISYRDMEALIHVSYASVFRYVRDPRRMSLKTFMLTCRALDLSPYDYIEDEDYQMELF